MELVLKSGFSTSDSTTPCISRLLSVIETLAPMLKRESE